MGHQYAVQSASFFGEIITGSYRHLDDEEEDYVGEVAGDWTCGEGFEKETELLVITEGDQAGSYSRLWGDLKVVGLLRRLHHYHLQTSQEYVHHQDVSASKHHL